MSDVELCKENREHIKRHKEKRQKAGVNEIPEFPGGMTYSGLVEKLKELAKKG